MLDFPGASIVITDQAYVITCEKPLAVISSAIIGGGLQSNRNFLNRHVPYNYYCQDPVADLQQFAAGIGISDSYIGMMTSVPMHGTRISNLQQGNIVASCIITAGVSNAITAGVSPPVVLAPGTINIVILLHANLSPSALVNAVITATEAKVSILQVCDVRASENIPATGTSTDAIAIGCTGQGEFLPYAGPATDVGYLIARSVRVCLLNALEPCGISYRKIEG